MFDHSHRAIDTGLGPPLAGGAQGAPRLDGVRSHWGGASTPPASRVYPSGTQFRIARPADRDDPPGAPADSTLTRTPAEAGDEQGYVDWHHGERTTVANVTLRAIKSLEIVALNRSLDRRNKLDRHSGNVLLILRGRVEGA